MKGQRVVCNFNFHTSFGGTQRSLLMALPALAQVYDLRVIDPYRNRELQQLLSAAGLSVETVVNLSQRTRISIHQGPRRLMDFAIASPTYFRAAMTFRNYFQRIRASLIYVNQTKSAAMAVVATPTAVPIIFHCHDAGSSGMKLVARFGKRLTRVIANSTHTRDRLLQAGFKHDQIRVVVNAVDGDDIRAQASRGLLEPSISSHSCQPILLLAHAEIEPNKGTLLAVEAFGEIVANGFQGELWIAGDVSPAEAVYAAKVRERVNDLAIGNRVRFLGRQSNIYAVMAQADIVLMPTIGQEPFGRVAVEAMALGKTVVASNRGALPSLVQDGVTGRIFDPQQPGQLAQVLSDIINDKAGRLQYGRSGANWVSDHLRPDEFNRRLLAVFAEVLPSH